MLNNQNIITYIEVKKQNDYYFANGAMSDVYKCNLVRDDRIVAVKVMRGTPDRDIFKRFQRKLTELVAQWQEIKHRNIMPCYGITLDFKPFPGVVLPFCTNGSILNFLKNRHVNKLDLLAQVSSGIAHIHSKGFLHADIRAANILVDDEGVPLVMDQGLSLLILPGEITTDNSLSTVRWNAPEILVPPEDNCTTPVDPEDKWRSSYTEKSDVYSLAMTILEVMTKKPPYSNLRRDTTVVNYILQGLHPQKPINFSDNLWSLLESCWERSPEKRPTAQIVCSWLDVIKLDVSL